MEPISSFRLSDVWSSPGHTWKCKVPWYYCVILLHNARPNVNKTRPGGWMEKIGGLRSSDLHAYDNREFMSCWAKWPRPEAVSTRRWSRWRARWTSRTAVRRWAPSPASTTSAATCRAGPSSASRTATMTSKRGPHCRRTSLTTWYGSEARAGHFCDCHTATFLVPSPVLPINCSLKLTYTGASGGCRETLPRRPRVLRAARHRFPPVRCERGPDLLDATLQADLPHC